MIFEYDEEKSRINDHKHGIDFERAQALWKDDTIFLNVNQFVEEKRYLVVGTIDHKHWTAVVTDRENSIRIISVRRSRKKEIEAYEKENEKNFS